MNQEVSIINDGSNYVQLTMGDHMDIIITDTLNTKIELKQQTEDIQLEVPSITDESALLHIRVL